MTQFSQLRVRMCIAGLSTPAQSHSCNKHVQKTVQELDYSVAVSQKKTLDRCHFHRHIAHHFLKQNTDSRQLEELPWQLERAGEFDQLAQVLSEPRYIYHVNLDQYRKHWHREMLIFALSYALEYSSNFNLLISMTSKRSVYVS